MEQLNELLKRVIAAADNMPQVQNEEEYCAQSPQHKEWFDAFNELRAYVETLPQ